jgi:uncharacterized peroxidase-related enzyme
MSRIEPLRREALPEHEGMFKMVEATMGFVPSSMLTMAKVPGLLSAFAGLAGTISNLGQIDRGLAQMIANMASNAAGCRYCQAHTAAHASHAGVSDEKIAKVWEFETSELFSSAERAALRVAMCAAQNPNGVTEALFEDLKTHYSEQQIIHIVATISLFGFLNRWNDTLATTLEAEPAAYASGHLQAFGWEIGKHGTR